MRRLITDADAQLTSEGRFETRATVTHRGSACAAQASGSLRSNAVCRILGTKTDRRTREAASVGDYTIGLATRDELSAVATVEVAAARSVPREDIALEVADQPMQRAELEQACRQRRLWVARVNGVVVGFVAGGLKDGLPYVCEIDVLPTHGRHGIGTALMRVAIQWARGKRASHLTLTTFRHLPYNAPFYAKLGFEEIPVDDLGPEIRAQLKKEARMGLDSSRRVAMRCKL